MSRFWRNNGLSIVLLLMFACSLVGQAVAGAHEHNAEQREHGEPPATLAQYVASSAFLEATMENWESEFLQMAVYVVFTVFLFQRGSAESKDPDGTEEVDRTPNRNRGDAPTPVRRGGVALALYRHSLSITLFALFAISLALHAVGGAGDYNDDQRLHGSAERVTALGYLATSRFWFESLQNWQSEFLSIAAMVLLTVWLREQGSPESKPVDAPHSQTGA